MPAVRNIRLCTKDCLCLMVCPTGATDTEDGQIDATKCLDGCRACVDACPGGAISFVSDVYPPQQEKADDVINVMNAISASKAQQEKIAKTIAAKTDDPIIQQFASALAMSNRMMGEDIFREAGYMLPQSENVQDLLRSMLDKSQPDDFPVDVVMQLLSIMKK